MKTGVGVTVVIPVKPWALSKSRLDVGEEAREGLARAFTLDVIEAVSASSLVGRIVFVTAERELGAVAVRIGAVLLSDRPMLSAGGLNAAVDSGRRWAMARHPTRPVIAVPGDLPALTTATFDHALDRLGRHDRAFVPDAAGRGTTLIWARSPCALHTSYGSRSAVDHSDAGFQAVPDVDPRARWDVDTRTDLVEARLLGVGVHTSAIVKELTTPRAIGRR